jgi:hypothetical protein
MLRKHTATGCGPGGSGCEKLAGCKHPLNTAEISELQVFPIRAELRGSNICVALGVTARSPSPVLSLCRKLVEAGFDPTTKLECYRGKVLALAVHSIGGAAGLQINSKGTRFIKRHAVRAAPLVRKSQPALFELPERRITGARP